MECARCQAEVVPGASFCDGCGAALGTLCAGCGGTNRTAARHCRHCGVRLAPPAGPAGEPALPGALPARLAGAAPGSYTPAHLAERILTTRGAVEGERKQVTVLFADVENFTGLGAVLDPEDLHALMDQVFATLLDVIHRYEGTVNQFTGDGVMALFGAPVALEAHALQAVEAALEVQRAMDAAQADFRARWGRTPRLRIGLNTGRVVVGRIGDDLRMDYTAQGDTVNLAARLQALAEPGTVAMSEATRRAVGHAVESVGLGRHAVKGRDIPVEVWRPLRVLRDRRRLAAAPDAGPGPFVGRESELTRLSALFEAVRRGQPRVAVVVGDAGVGKSRLLLELRRRMPAGVRWFEGHCVPYGRSTPYRPVVELLRRTFGIGDRDAEAEAARKLDKRLGQFGDEGRQIAPALRYLLAIGPPDADMALLSPTDRKTAVAHALEVLTQRSVDGTPQVFVLEDCQWMDPASAEYLERATREMVRGPMMFVLTMRPEAVRDLAAAAGGVRIELSTLAPAEARTLVHQLAGTRGLTEELVSRAVDRAGGSPLFLQELTRALLDNETAEMPPSVADVLTARIDRLPAALKQVLQVAAVFGRRFSAALVQHVARDVSDVPGRLRALTEQGLVGPDEEPGWYAFQSGLLGEATYEGLLHQRRKTLHRLAGEAIETLYAGRLSEHIHVLARHFLHAEDWRRAVHYLREAGRAAAGLCANTEAVQHFERALEVLGRLEGSDEVTREAIDVRLELRAPLLQLGRLEEMLRLSREAEEQANALGDGARLASVHAHLVNYHYLKGEPERAIEVGRRWVSGAGAAIPAVARSVRQYLASSHHAMGRYDVAEAMLRDNMAELEQGGDLHRSAAANLLYVSSAGWRAFALAEMGRFEAAHASAEAAVRAAEESGHAYSRAIASTMASLVRVWQGQLERAVPALEATLALCREHHLSVWTPIPSFLLGRAYAGSGRAERGLALIREAMAQTEALGINAYRSLWQAHLAEALLADGQPSAAAEAARAALDLAERFGEGGNRARALVLTGEIALGGGAAGAGEALERGLAEAEARGMQPLVARCHAALGRLAGLQGDPARAAMHAAEATRPGGAPGPADGPPVDPPAPAGAPPRPSAAAPSRNRDPIDPAPDRLAGPGADRD